MKEDVAEIKALSGWTGAKTQRSERVLLCLTLKVFDLQQGDPAAGSSKNALPRRVEHAAVGVLVYVSAHYCVVTFIHTHLLLWLRLPAA